jgi:hypothetical protein
VEEKKMAERIQGRAPHTTLTPERESAIPEGNATRAVVACCPQRFT